MARQKSTERILSLEEKQRELMRQLKAARSEAVKRDRQDAERRASLLGKAALKVLSRADLENLVGVAIPAFVKRPTDLALFDEWLAPTAIALPADKKAKAKP